MSEVNGQIENGLPKDWKKVQLGKVCKLKNGFAFKSSGYDKVGVPVVRISDINDGIVEIEDSVRVEPKEDYNEFIIENGDILVAMSGATTGKFGIYKSSEKAYQNQRVGNFKVIDDSLNKTFLFYQLHSLKKRIEKDAYGGAQPNISSKKIEEMEITLAPLDVQKLVVSKIEELFSEVDKSIVQLKTAQQQLKIYSKSVLARAFENDKVIWGKKLLSEISEKIQIGPFGTQLHKEDYIIGGIPLINPMHIQGGVIVADNSYSIREDKRDGLPNYILQEGDVIMGRRGEMGRCGLVTQKEHGWFCGTGSLYVRPDKRVANSKFIYYLLQSETIKKYLEENAGGTTMANLNLKIVSNIPFSLPPIQEQEQIILDIESRLSVADKIQETITTSLQQAESLKQSILKKAFEGKLLND